MLRFDLFRKDGFVPYFYTKNYLKIKVNDEGYECYLGCLFDVDAYLSFCIQIMRPKNYGPITQNIYF